MNTPLVSVIVPVYKVENYLVQCIDSILAQTYTNFELLLIDDGSPDNSGKICDEYAAKDSRIKVFHKENGGVSSARNLGLDNATGEWISFVDSDDWIDEDMYEILMSEISRNECDILFFGYQKEIEGRETNVIKYSENVKYYNSTDKITGVYELEKAILFGWTWCKLFRKQIIESNHLYFNQSISLWEDHIFSLQFMCKARNMTISPIAPYHYRDVESSLIKNRNSSFDSKQKLLDKMHYNRIALIESACSKSYSDYLKYTNTVYLQQSFTNLKSLYKTSNCREVRIVSISKCRQTFANNIKLAKKCNKLLAMHLILMLPNSIVDIILNSLFR